MQKSLQLISITPEELQRSILDGVKSCLDDLKSQFQPKEPTDYLTRQEVADLLKVDLSTVYRWSQLGKLKSYGLGNRVYYKRKEVEETLVPLNNQSHTLK